MKNILRQDDIKTVEDRIRLFEDRTGCELMLIVANSSDEYPGAIWRFGVLGSFITCFIFSLFLDFHYSTLWPLLFLVSTLTWTYLGKFPFAKRLALSDREVDRECTEKAIEYFHTLGTSKVQHKVTAMIMASVLERKIMVLVDERLRKEISQSELDELVTVMKPHFQKGDMSLGFLESIAKLEEKILQDFGGKVSDVAPSELSNQIIFV